MGCDRLFIEKALKDAGYELLIDDVWIFKFQLSRNRLYQESMTYRSAAEIINYSGMSLEEYTDELIRRVKQNELKLIKGDKSDNRETGIEKGR